MIFLILKYLDELQISHWMFCRYGLSDFSNQPFLQNCVQVKSRDLSSYISLDSPGIAVATLILYVFLKKRLNSCLNPSLLSSCSTLFSISIKNDRKLSEKATSMINLVYLGRLIIGPLNQLESPVRCIMIVSSILALMRIGLFLVNRCEIALFLLNNTS